MPLLEDLLLRFRRIWAPPGAVAGQASVPADLQARVDDELRELTVALDAIGREGQAVVEASEREAAAVLAAARAEAQHRIEAARARVPEERSLSASAHIRDRGTEIDARISEAELQAGAIRSRAAERMRPLVDQVTAEVFAGVGGELEVADARVVGGG
ncbi:MAG: hypothetical protein ACHQ0J_09335 [Candidatus Dormibacterales bacterium]